MRKYFAWLPDWWIARLGFALMLLGLAIVLVYHGIILTILPFEQGTEEVIGTAGHIIVFIGMNLMLGAILFERKKRNSSGDTPAEYITHQPARKTIVVRPK